MATPAIGSQEYYQAAVDKAQAQLDALNAAMIAITARYADWYNLVRVKGNGALVGQGSCGLNAGCSDQDRASYYNAVDSYNNQQALINAKIAEIASLKKSLATAQTQQAAKSPGTIASEEAGKYWKPFLITLLIVGVIAAGFWIWNKYFRKTA